MKCIKCHTVSATSEDWIVHAQQCVYPAWSELKHTYAELQEKLHRNHAKHQHDLLTLQQTYEKAQQEASAHYQKALQHHKQLSNKETLEAEVTLFKRIHTQRNQEELRLCQQKHVEELTRQAREAEDRLQQVHGQCAPTRHAQQQRIDALKEELTRAQQSIRELATRTNTLTKQLEEKDEYLAQTQTHHENRHREHLHNFQQFKEKEEYLKRELTLSQECIQGLKQQVEHYQKEMTAFKEELTTKTRAEMTQFRDKLQGQCEQLQKENRTHCSSIKRLMEENRELTEQNREMSALRETLKTTQKTLREYMQKCKELENNNKTPSRKTVHFRS